MALPADVRRVHCIGIGGIGMSALAQLLKERGYEVSGSDVKHGPLIDRLRRRGVTVVIGHGAANVPQADLVVHSSCIHADNPEWQAAKRRGMPLLTRGACLAALIAERQVIAITGAHGKSTTTGLIAQALHNGQTRAGYAVGGDVASLQGYACWGSGAWFVAEADESDGSFLHLAPRVAVATNIDREHLDYYQSFDRLVEAFERFLASAPREGTLVINGEDATLAAAAQAARARVIRYGLAQPAQLRADAVQCRSGSVDFVCFLESRRLGPVHLNIPGRHNVSNALAAIGAGLAAGASFEGIVAGLEAFSGVARRFQTRRLPMDIVIINDYAHHPAEIRATLAAVDRAQTQRLVAVFQPHRYTRTVNLLEEFGRAFAAADAVIITDIYAAFEPPIPGITAERVAEQVRRCVPVPVYYVPKSHLLDMLSHEVAPGDTVCFLGAGDIGELSDAFTVVPALADRV